MVLCTRVTCICVSIFVCIFCVEQLLMLFDLRYYHKWSKFVAAKLSWNFKSSKEHILTVQIFSPSIMLPRPSSTPAERAALNPVWISWSNRDGSFSATDRNSSQVGQFITLRDFTAVHEVRAALKLSSPCFLLFFCYSGRSSTEAVKSLWISRSDRFDWHTATDCSSTSGTIINRTKFFAAQLF